MFATRRIIAWSDLEQMEKVADAIEAKFAEYAAQNLLTMLDVDTLELARIAIEAMAEGDK